MKSSKRSQVGFSILASVLVIVSSVLVIFRARKAGGMTIRGVKPVQAIRDAFTGTKFEALIPYLIAQAKHETGNFQSQGYLQNNNMFGMSRPRRRVTLDNPKRDGIVGPLIIEGKSHANFDTPFDSARDMFLWLNQWTSSPFPTEVDSVYEYVQELLGADKGRVNYFTDSWMNYSKGMSNWF